MPLKWGTRLALNAGPGFHPASGPSSSWMDGLRRASAPSVPMPIELTDAELATAASACRAMAYQEGKRAEKMENPATRASIAAAAQRYALLAEKLEAARRRATR